MNPFELVWRRLAMVSLWYCALTAGLLITLALIAFYQPIVVSYVLVGAPALAWLTPAEAAHMADVHTLVRDALLLALSAAIILGSYWYARGLDRSLTKAAMAMMGVLVLLLIPFNWTFTRFHAIFFPQGNWQFAANSWLIRTFPIWFFALVALAWLASSLALLYVVQRSLLASFPGSPTPRTRGSRRRAT